MIILYKHVSWREYYKLLSVDDSWVATTSNDLRRDNSRRTQVCIVLVNLLIKKRTKILGMWNR